MINDSDSENRPRSVGTIGETGLSFKIRPIVMPGNASRSSKDRQRKSFSEVIIGGVGFSELSAIVETANVSEALLQELARNVVRSSRIEVSADHGGLDIYLEGRDGKQVKSGVVVLEGPKGPISVPADPKTRRFQIGGLVPGSYKL